MSIIKFQSSKIFIFRRKWLRTRFSERGESAEIVAAFNASVLSKPETLLEGASRGPIGRILTDDIQLRFPTEDQRPYALYGLDPSSREYIMRWDFQKSDLSHLKKFQQNKFLNFQNKSRSTNKLQYGASTTALCLYWSWTVPLGRGLCLRHYLYYLSSL